jgi:TolB-like protein
MASIDISRPFLPDALPWGLSPQWDLHTLKSNARPRLRRYFGQGQGGFVKTGPGGSQDIAEEEIRAACEFILASEDFQKAHRMRRLFRFLTEQAMLDGRGNVSEYTIGIEVFDRKPEDLISEDPAIRVQVGRLRHRLSSYYLKHGVLGDVEISIPAGRYMPAFHRICSQAEHVVQSGDLVVQPIKCLADRLEGQAFASGLYEELLDQLVSSFGDIFMRAESSSTVSARTTPRRLIEGSLRVDGERMRTSIRVVDYSLSRITWAKHFDRSLQFGIRDQEELAASICYALREVVDGACPA